MLEIRYNKKTGEISGWSGSARRFLKPRTPDEVVKVIDAPIPSLDHRLIKFDLTASKIVSK